MTLPLATLFWRVLLGIAAFGTVSSSVFLFLAIIAAIRFKRRSRKQQASVLSILSDQLPPVTIFKPVHGMEARGNAQVVSAHVPLSEMFGYATDVRSMTQGRATYTMQFERYDEVPPNIADRVVGEQVAA